MKPKRNSWSARGGLVLLALVTGPALAQVPQHAVFRGRLLNASGTPQTGPVSLELWLFDVETGGTAIYGESYAGVPLDVTGAFAVQFGLGTPLMAPPGSSAADLFSAVPRWLEVKQGAEVLTPRVRIGSAPWALVAQQASKIVTDPTAPRFEDCDDGTVADHKTGLQWEKKTETTGPHNVNDSYTWSASPTGSAPDGTAFTDFLAKLNAKFDPQNPTGCFADRCDWRLPEISELQTILIGPDADPGQAQTCSVALCIDPDFAAVGGPTAATSYWSASTNLPQPSQAWNARFYDGFVTPFFTKSSAVPVRAVRVGSCN